LHEAVQHEGDGTHPIVGSVLRRGYKVGDQVVRHALVGVVDTVPDAGEEEPAKAAESVEEADNADVASERAAESTD
jgi:molecular chaperone GrpE